MRDATSVLRERQRQAFELRASGLSFDAIARQLGYKNRSGTYKAWKRAMATHDEEVELYRDLQKIRLETVLNSVWPKVLAGDVQAGRLVVSVVETIAQLYGLEIQPEDHAIDVEPEIRTLAAAFGHDEEQALQIGREVIAERGYGERGRLRRRRNVGGPKGGLEVNA
jgi:hypothetical protein